jgi:diguanylate cyclase (GGDEF)-like protein/PAS domain S-box-containing protein
LLVGLIVVLSLGAVSVLLGGANLNSAEKARLAERVRLTRSIGSYVTQAYDPAKLRGDVERTPFSQANPALNELLLQQFQVTPTGDPNVVVALIGRDGRSIAARPEKNALTVDLLGDAWPRALAGEVAESQTLRINGEVLRAYAVPVGTGRPWAVLVSVPRDESGQQFQQRLRGLGTDGGGFSTVDANGIVLTSWQPETVGTRELDRADMAAIQATGFRMWRTGSGSSETVHIAAVTNSGFAQVFTQRTDDLFADLRKAQATHDLATLAVLATAVAALGLLGWRREHAARREQARLHALLKNAHDLVLVVDPDSTTRFVSPAIEDMLGYDPMDWTGRPLLELVHPGDLERMSSLIAEGHDARVLNIRFRARDGSVRWFDVEASDRSAEAQLGGVLLTCHEIGERKDLQDQLSYQASHDELTGLANRSVFCERVELARRAADSGPGRAIAVLFVDLDHFKPVNDTLGHDAGDQVLRTVAARFSAAVRSEDLVCRFGGDEFGVLLLDTDEPTACEVAARLVRAAQAPIAVGATLVRIDASIGITLWSGSGSAFGTGSGGTAGGRALDGPEALIRAADEAMYVAKQSGRGRYAVHRRAAAEEVSSTADEVAAPANPSRGSALPTVQAAAPAFARAFASAPPRSWGNRLRHWLPLIVTGAMVIVIAGLGSGQEAHATAAAEARRVAERSDITARVAEYSAVVTAPGRLLPAVQQAPWNLDDLSANSAVLAAFSDSPAAGPNSVVSLARVDGTIAESYPANATAALPSSDRTWTLARSGIAGFSSVQDRTTVPRAWYTLPIMRGGRPAAILLIGQSVRNSEIGRLMVAVGSLGFGEGGLFAVDPRGVTIVSYDPDLIARQMLSTTDLAGLHRGEVRRINRDGMVMLVTPAWQQDDPNPRYVVFRQPAAVFFGDLRSGQGSRNALMLVLVCVSVLGLGLLNRRRELSERRSRAHLRALLHSAHDLVIALDRSGRTTFVSSAIEGLLGHPSTDWLGRDVLDLVDGGDRERLAAALQHAWREGEGDRFLSDVRLTTVDGSTRWFDVGIADLTADAAVSGLLITCHEIGERKRLQDELSHRARHDVLTGLANRASFVRHLAAVTDSGRAFAVLFVDLDHFKPVNDRYGHDAGDAVLQAVAGRLEGAVRGGAQRPDDLICRLGGDEFAVLVGGVDDVGARQVADRMLDAIRQPIRIGTGTQAATVVIGATIGIAFADPSDPSLDPDLLPEAVVQRADSAMYAAKVAGRGRYSVFGG